MLQVLFNNYNKLSNATCWNKPQMCWVYYFRMINRHCEQNVLHYILCLPLISACKCLFHSQYSAWHIVGTTMINYSSNVCGYEWMEQMDWYIPIYPSRKYFKENISYQFLLLKSRRLLVKILMATPVAHFNHLLNKCSVAKDHGGRRDQGEWAQELGISEKLLSE